MSIGYLAYLWVWSAGEFVDILCSSEEKPPNFRCWHLVDINLDAKGPA